jgi:hypothetical protein
MDTHSQIPPIDGRAAHTPPAVGDSVLSVRTYDEAVAAVDLLADASYPIEHVSIVGHGVETVEDVTGRFGAMGALQVGALTGGLVGLFFGLIFDWWGTLTPEVGWLWLALEGALYGAVVGAVFALLLQPLGSGSRGLLLDPAASPSAAAPWTARPFATTWSSCRAIRCSSTCATRPATSWRSTARAWTAYRRTSAGC